MVQRPIDRQKAVHFYVARFPVITDALFLDLAPDQRVAQRLDFFLFDCSQISAAQKLTLKLLTDIRGKAFFD